MGEITTVYFAGPSIFGVEVEHLPDELWLPPAAQGDVLRAAMTYRPKQIVLIDGVFHMSLSMWVKEGIWCLLEGIEFVGAASMGALRASELWRYGAIPIGKIAQMYVDGQEDDALVALMFDPISYRPLSEPVVGHLQKREDALEAIDFARSHATRPRQPVNTLLDRSAINETLNTVLQRILADA
jgi:hypothetical protein